MPTARKDLKDMLREGVRQTIQQTLGSVIQEVTEEELRSVLREPSFRGPLVELELEQAIQELRENGKKKRSRRERR